MKFAGSSQRKYNSLSKDAEKARLIKYYCTMSSTFDGVNLLFFLFFLVENLFVF